MRPISLGGRFFGTLLGLVGYWLASPGTLTPDGSCLGGILAVGLWGAFAVRPARPLATGERRRFARPFPIEWLAATLGAGLLFWWIYYVVPVGLLYIAVGWGFYGALAGLFTRALARRWRPALAVALGFWAAESLRAALPIPFGCEWLRLGHFSHAQLWLSGSARVWGIEGLTLVLALCAGAVAELLALRPSAQRTLCGLGLTALLPLGLAALLALLVRPQETRPGPRVLLIQPSFPQEVKQFADPRRTFADLHALTRAEIDRHRTAGAAPPDLVCWGETMLPLSLFEPAAQEALVNGVEPAPWRELDPEWIRQTAEVEDDLVRRRVLGVSDRSEPGAAALPPGTAFLTGVEVFDLVEGEIAPLNAVVLYDAQGRRSRPAAKRYLVPGAETMVGLERFQAVRDVVYSIAAYVPDFRAAQETAVLELVARDAESYGIAASVCFDNGYIGPYVRPVAREAVDFHLVVSNEAWYRDAAEMDLMMAFSRVAALASDRALVRATNSGISAVLGGDGVERGRLTVGGRDRSVAGSLFVQVPVPAADATRRTPYARLFGLWRLAGVLVPLLFGFVPGRGGNRRSAAG